MTNASHQIRCLFELIDAAQWSELGTFFHPQVDYLRPGFDPIRGLDALTDFYCHRRCVKTGRHVVERVCTGGDGRSVVAVGSFTGRDHDGRSLNVRFCDVYEFEEGKVRRRETFFNSPAI